VDEFFSKLLMGRKGVSFRCRDDLDKYATERDATLRSHPNSGNVSAQTDWSIISSAVTARSRKLTRGQQL
jgi:hypothetical protein